MDFEGIGPGRQAGHDIELTKQTGQDDAGIVLFGQLLEIGHHALEREFDTANRLLGKIFPLGVQALLMFEELFAVELDEG